MRPIRLRFGGVTCYDDPVDLDVEALGDGIIGITGKNGSGKGLRMSETLYTPDGPTTAQELRVGDRLFAGDGTECTITGVYRQPTQPVYRIRFGDQSSLVTDADHIWLVRTPDARFRERSIGWSTKTTRELFEWDHTRPPNRCTVPLTCPLVYPETDPPIDPYIFGVMLGDGSFRSGVVVHTPDEFIVAKLREYAEFRGLRLNLTGPLGWRFVGSKGHQNVVINDLRELGVFGKLAHEKHIPDVYRFASVEQRLSLIRGLMDTDGTVGKRGNTSFTTTSPAMSAVFEWMCKSLGWKARTTRRITHYTYKGERKPGRPSYRTNIRAYVNPFTLPKKAQRWHPPRCPERVIRSVEVVGEEPTVCFAVDSSDSTFIAGEDLVVTHNTSLVSCLLPIPLYLSLPYLDDSLHVHCTSRKSFVDLDYEFDGHRWRSQVLVDVGATDKSTPKTEARLWRDGDLLPGDDGRGLVSTYKAHIEEHMPPKSVVLASAFAVQGGKHSFGDLDAKARRSLFRTLIGAEPLQALSDAAGVDRLALDKELAVVSQSLADATKYAEAATEAEAMLHDARGQLWRAAELAQDQQCRINVERAEIAVLDAELQRLRNEVEPRRKAATDRLVAAQHTLSVTEREVLTIEAMQRSETERHVAEITNAETASSLIDEVPCEGLSLYGGRYDPEPMDCSKCPLLTSAFDARAKLPELRERYVRDEKVRLDVLATAKANAEQARHELDSATEARNAAYCDGTRIDELQDKVRARQAVIAEAERQRRGHAPLVQSKQAEVSRLEGRLETLRDGAHDTAGLRERRDGLAHRRAGLSLLERAFGPEGVQALEIDAAGPGVSRIANELLDELSVSYSVELVTLRAEGKGRKQREVFDILVHDGVRGTQRELGRMSGGERVVIEESLKLAIAVYVAQDTGGRIGTLVRDESDTGLDAEAQLRYPAMLRKAMNLGGFDRCFLISHNEAVVAQCDTRIVVANGKVEVWNG